MPRLSVDIDLTYISIEDRDTSLANIKTALGNIKTRIEKVVPGVRVIDRSDRGKLQISQGGTILKLEVNLVGRGTIADPVEMPLCSKAQEEFEVFCSIQTVPLEQLYGGKICAALDRQHPRDLFDVKYLLETEGFSPGIKKGFFLCLLGSDRPIHEIINPNLQDQRSTLEKHFAGMSNEDFSYEEFEFVRRRLIDTIHKSLTKEDKEFLLSIKNLEPDWSLYDFSRFPAIIWKLQNLQRLKENNPEKHSEQYEFLRKTLNRF
jgi:predicted nucleotidyltransferase component of viral defense system